MMEVPHPPALEVYPHLLPTFLLLVHSVGGVGKCDRTSSTSFWNQSALMALVTLSDMQIKEYEEREYLRAKCRFYQGFRVKDREAFETWIYKQWSPDQFNLEDDFKKCNYDTLYARLLHRFNVTQRQIYESCRNLYYPFFNDTRERTHREEFRAIYLIHREYQFKMDHWLHWLVDFMPYYVKKIQRDRIEKEVDQEGQVHFNSIVHQFEYERRIDERVHECKGMIRDLLYKHGNDTLEEFAFEVSMGDRHFVQLNATVREDFIKRCNMFLDLRQKHHQFLQREARRLWCDDSQEIRYFTRVPK